MQKLRTKWRIIKAKTPYLSTSNGCVDFVPKIEYREQFEVQFCSSFLFGIINDWTTTSVHSYLEQAERRIEFLKCCETSEIIKEYEI
jgi:hypothetical protein